MHLGMQRYRAPEGDASASGGTEQKPAGTPAPDKGKAKPNGEGTFSQADVNRLIAEERRRNEEKYTALDGKYSKLESEHNTIKEILEDAAREVEESEAATRKGADSTGDPLLDEFEQTLIVPPGVKDPDTYRRIQRTMFLQRRHSDSLLNTVQEQSKQIDKLTGLVEEERTARKTAEQAQIDYGARSRLMDALNKNRCIDLDVGVKIFREQVEYDAATRDYKFKRKDGTVVSILDGITEEIPAYLVQSATDGGGSGATGGRQVVTDQQLQGLRTKLEAAHLQAKKTGNMRDVQIVQRLEREIKQAESERVKR